MVTPGSAPPAAQVADNGNSIITAFQKGEISQDQFESKLAALGWNPEQIRQALAVIHKLPHQMGAPVPDQMHQIQQGVQKATQQANSQPGQTTQAATPDQTSQPIAPEQTAQSMVPYQTQQPSVQTPQVQTDTSTTPQNNTWTMVTIIATLGAAAAIGGGLYTFKLTRKVTN